MSETRINMDLIMSRWWDIFPADSQFILLSNFLEDDAWHLRYRQYPSISDTTLHRIRLLQGPYYKAIIEAWEFRRTTRLLP